jgi:hypothetical protein
MNALAKANSNVNYRPILSSEKMLYKDSDGRCSIEKILGRESQGAWREDELIGGIPSVVKLL